MRKLPIEQLLTRARYILISSFLFATVSSYGQLSVEVAVMQSSCQGATGMATATPSNVTGTAMYSWDNTDDAILPTVPSSTASISNLVPGNYSLTVTDDGALDVIETFFVRCSVACGYYNETLETDCSNLLLPSSLGGNDVIHELVFKYNNVALSPANEITESEIGKTLVYEINLISTGANACWGEITIEDKSDPVLTCPPDVELYCFESLDPADNGKLGVGTATDCSGKPTISYYDQASSVDCDMTRLGSSFSSIITRTWVATDSRGNSTTCEQTISIRRASFVDITFPDDYSEECSSSDLDTDPSNTGYPQYFPDNHFLTFGSFGSSAGEFNTPAGIAVDASGNIYVADHFNHRIQIFDATGSFVSEFGGMGAGDGLFNGPVGVAIDAAGNIIVADRENHRIQIFDSSGIFISKFGSFGAGNSNFNRPNGIAIDASGNLYVCDTNNDEIKVFNSTQTFVRKFGGNGNADGELDNPLGVAVDGSGNILVADSNNDRIQVFSSTGIFQSKFGSSGSDEGEFNFPAGVALDGDSNIHVTDVNNNRIQIFDSAGKFLVEYGSSGSLDGEFMAPRALAVQNNLTYVVDRDNHRIQLFGSWVPLDLISGGTNGACMIISSSEDDNYEKCGPDRVIKRNWRILNMCENGEPNEIAMGDQLITITTKLPEFNPIRAITLAADHGKADAHGGCSSTGSLPTGTLMALCADQVVAADDITISIPGIGSTSNGGDIPFPGLALGGPYTITYTAVDSCGNQGTLDVLVTVVDSTGPQCITQNVNLTLQPSGLGQIHVEAIDKNSFDNCRSSVFKQIRRINGSCTGNSSDEVFGKTVNFCCEDVTNGSTGEVMVQMIVCDLDPTLANNYDPVGVVLNADGSPGATFKGNCTYENCMALVTVKIPEVIDFTCPAMADVDCVDYSDTVRYGVPTFTTICSSVGLDTTFTDAGTLECDGGTILRTWYLIDGTDTLNQCTQTINVTGSITISPPEDITIPCDTFDLTNLPPQSVTGFPTVTGTGCSNSTIIFQVIDSDSTLVDNILRFTRTWIVDPVSDPLECFSDTSFVQQITTEANCCSNPLGGINSQNGGTAELNLVEPRTDYFLLWYDNFSGASGTGSPLPNMNFPSIAVSADSLMLSGLTDQQPISIQIRQANNRFCSFVANGSGINSRIINGIVTTVSGIPVPNALVALESTLEARVVGAASTMAEVITDEEGVYELEIENLEDTNKLILSKGGDDRDQISTLDMLVLARHILGIKEITSPYSYIAADLTGNGTISTGDLLEMQRLILGITKELKNNSSWRFVREDHVFDDMNTILDYDFPESFDFTKMSSEDELDNLNFIAIKVGDLSSAYDAGLLGGNSTTKTLSLKTDNQTIIPGSIIEVPITAAAANNLSGYQHAYKYDTDKLIFTGIKYGSVLNMGDDNFGFSHLNEGVLTTSWYDTKDVDVEEGAILYTLKFEVFGEAQLSDALALSSLHTEAEAYFDEHKIGDIQFSFGEAIADQLLMTNSPNPFTQSTLVRFNAPTTGEAVITVSDISGRMVYRSDMTAAKGDNQLVINKSDLRQAGIYLLKIELNGSAASQKIVLIE